MKEAHENVVELRSIDQVSRAERVRTWWEKLCECLCLRASVVNSPFGPCIRITLMRGWESEYHRGTESTEVSQRSVDHLKGGTFGRVLPGKLCECLCLRASVVNPKNPRSGWAGEAN